MDRLTDRLMDRLTDRLSDGQIDRKTDEQTDKQVDQGQPSPSPRPKQSPGPRPSSNPIPGPSLRLRLIFLSKQTLSAQNTELDTGDILYCIYLRRSKRSIISNHNVH